MKGGHKIDYKTPFSEKEKLSLLSAFMILDLKRLLVGNKPLNAKKAWLIFIIDKFEEPNFLTALYLTLFESFLVAITAQMSINYVFQDYLAILQYLKFNS